MPDPTYELWCLFQRDTVLFPVTTSPTTSIGILKKQIKVEGERTLFSGIDALSLNLWQADVDYPEIKNKVRKGEYVFDTGEKEPLEEMIMVSDVWPQPPSRNQIHIYITLRPGMSLTLDQRAAPKKDVYAWLEEIHSKIWKKKHLKRDLFREVKVTQAHYNELQERLNAQHPDRCSPEYDGDHDVLRVKLDVLQLVQNEEDGSKMDVDGPEVSDGDDDKKFFPFTLRFLDLSTLNLENVPGRIPLLLYLRQEYDDITALIGQNHDSVIVTGQPGTGKTTYLHIRVIQSMIEGRSFLYQAQNQIVYHVNDEGVTAIESWSSSENIVAFVDGDKAGYEPDHILCKSGVQIILASPPKGATARWISQGQGHINIIATDLWSFRELFITGVFLHRLDISPDLLSESVLYFGCNPRRCFISARSAKVLHQQTANVASKITSIKYKNENMMQLVYASRTGDQTVSHSIFQNFPRDKQRQLSECGFRLVSHWAFRLFIEEYKSHEAHRANDFYRQISGVPRAASLWGHVFEQKVLHHIDTCGGRKFEIRGLSSPSIITWECPAPIRRYTFLREADFIREITKAIKENKSLHLVPSASNFEAVDSIIYTPNEVLTCIQATVSGEHAISVPGLQRLQNWLGAKPPLAHLCPLPHRPWRLIFIVPPGDASTYEMQQFNKDTKTGEWAHSGKVLQYVLGLDVLEKIQNDNLGGSS